MEENTQEIKNRGWQVTFAGLGINLALGVLYTWGVIKTAIPEAWNWSDTDKTLPYSIATLVFAFMTVPAGRLQDKIGPRWIALAGGICVGVGMILASQFTTPLGFVLCFGLLTGAGIGMGYACATPPAVKWFPANRTGLIAGLVVSGFGLAAAWISPLARELNKSFGLQTTMMIFGIAFLVIVSTLSQLLRNPPPGWKPQSPPAAPGAAKPKPATEDFTWSEMLRTPQFWLLWFMYAFAAGAGLMIIPQIATIVKDQAHNTNGFVFIALLAVGNASGRILSGALSDKIGRKATMLIAFIAQAAILFSLRYVTQDSLFYPIAILIGMNFGANLALFPAVTKDFFGLKNFGVNYGFVFTAWGVGGFVLSQISSRVYDAAKAGGGGGNYYLAYLIAGGALILSAALAFALRAPKPKAPPAAA